MANTQTRHPGVAARRDDQLFARGIQHLRDQYFPIDDPRSIAAHPGAEMALRR
jgi:hypothetical protein